MLVHAVVPGSREDAAFYHWPMSAKYSINKVYKMNILNDHDHDDTAHNDDNTIKTSGIVPVGTMINTNVYEYN